MGEIQKIEGAASAIPATQGDNAIISMIERAARDPSVDIDKMERLMAMQERMVAQRAQAAFASAFAQMQMELPSIAERGKGHGNITYATWEDINDAVKPVLAKHGFGLRFEVGRAGERLTITGVLMHREGHSERTMMELPADTSGSKNAVQAVGSSTSYGKRYVASALLNLTSRLPEDRDDDGKRGGIGHTVTDAQAEQLRDAITKAGGDIVRFVRFFKIECLPDLPAARFDEAMRMIDAKRTRQ
ncbi:ERF family protein [Methylobacterium komagatae]